MSLIAKPFSGKIKFGIRIVLPILAVLLVIYACGRTQDNPSIKHQEKSPYDTVFFDEIHQQTYEDPLLARTRSLKTLDSLSPDDQVSKIMLLKYIGSSYVFETNYPEAIKYYNKALAIAEEINHYIEVANLNNNLGMIFNELGNFKTSYSYYKTALNYYDLANQPDKKIGTLNNIGVIYLSLDNYDKARSYFEEAIDSTIQHKDTILVASVLNNIAICYSETQPDRALEYLDETIALSGKVNNQYGLCISYQIMGSIYLDSGEKQKAFEAYSTSIDIAEKANLTHQLAISKVGIAQVLLSMEKTEDALDVAFEVMQVAKEKNSLVLKSSAHQVLSDVYKQNNDYKNSLINFQEHIKAQEELTNQTVINQIYDVEVSHLSQLNTLQRLELEKKEFAISKKKHPAVFYFPCLFIGIDRVLFSLPKP